MRGWNQLWSSTEAFSSGSLAASLGAPQLLCPQFPLGPGGHLGLTKNLGGKGSEESSIPSGTSG